MELKANVNFDRFEAALQVVDAHTVGELPPFKIKIGRAHV